MISIIENIEAKETMNDLPQSDRVMLDMDGPDNNNLAMGLIEQESVKKIKSPIYLPQIQMKTQNISGSQMKNNWGKHVMHSFRNSLYLFVLISQKVIN